MERLRIIKPSILLTPYVEEYWLVSASNIAEGFQRLIPIGCVAITFNRSNPAFSMSDCNFYPQAYVSGQMTSFSDLKYSAVFDFFCVIFRPSGAMRFLGIPISEFYNQHVPIECLNNIRLKETAEIIKETESDESCISLIETFLLKQAGILDAENYNRLDSVIKCVYNKGLDNVSSLAKEACLSYKQFYRIFTQSIGISPNNYLRIYRLRKLLCLLRFKPFLSLNELASECGYYDKSHLLKELKEFTGFGVSQYLLQDSFYSSFNPLFHSAFIDLK